MLGCPTMAPMTPDSALNPSDLARLAAAGIAPEEAHRQLQQLREPPPALELARPCTIGDGIERLDDEARARLASRHDEAAARGELSAFIPASGAASRMFRDLLACRNDAREWTRAELDAAVAAGSEEGRALRAFVDGIERFAFHDALAQAVTPLGSSLAALVPAGPYRPLLAALLDPDALDFAALPKGLIPFHASAAGPRTAFEEHLAEAAQLYADADGKVRLQSTVSPEHLERFRALLDRLIAETPAKAPCYDVAFSTQEPSTDTLAIDESGAPFRDSTGALVLRPAGHGALLTNLARSAVPLAMIKNIDNIAAEPYRAPTIEWTRAIVGRLCELRERSHALVRRLRDTNDTNAVGDARNFAIDTGLEPENAHPGTAAPSRESMRALLDRPWRICGMVPNTGEPGGGPFWVRGAGGQVSRQIVESAQVRAGDAAQLAIFRAATHFNPVFLACALDDAAGGRHDLERFVDHTAAIVTRRSAGGRNLVALERPGLWNGSMAHWNTVFVEVPLTVFNPVKTVNDLLRREHQGTK